MKHGPFVIGESDLVWLAGLLEGEGTFDLHRGKYPRIRVGMTDRDVVGRAATLMGSRIRMTISKVHKTTFHAEVSGDRAADIMRALLPHMGARRSSKIGDILGGLAFRREGLENRVSFPGPALTRPPGTFASA
jgi:hypothetical protein